MNPRGLLIILCVLGAAVALAHDTPRQQSGSSEQDTGVLNLAPPAPHQPNFDRNGSGFVWTPRFKCDHGHNCVGEWYDGNGNKHTVTGRMRMPDPNPTCYTMRSYYFERVPGSPDSLRKDGETTCTPSSRYRVWSSDGTPTPAVGLQNAVVKPRQ